MSEYCEIKDVTFRYFKDSERNVLEHVNLSFSKGEVAVLIGDSGCGKSTLAAVLCGLYPENGGYLVSGSILLNGNTLESLSFRERSRYMVQMFQNPDLQFCMENLREELYFCLENIQVSQEQMRERVEQAAKEYQVEALLDQPFCQLSGGEKQRAALACLLLLNPEILVLDEPFANLDQAAAKQYMALLKKEMRQKKKTIIAIDHRPENWISIADRFVLLGEKGAVRSPYISPAELRKKNWYPCRQKEVSLQDGEKKETVLSVVDGTIWHKKAKQPVLERVNVDARKGEMIACLGSSGGGKTSLFLSLLGQKKYKGSIALAGVEINKIKKKELFRKMGLVFQNPANQFVTTMVGEEIATSLKIWTNDSETDRKERTQKILEQFGLQHFRKFSPFMLSQGQQRRLGVATMLAGGQQILLLDEPTYGQDYKATKAIMEALEQLAEKGITIIFSTHDQELARAYAHRCWRVEGGTAYVEYQSIG